MFFLIEHSRTSVLTAKPAWPVCSGDSEELKWCTGKKSKYEDHHHCCARRRSPVRSALLMVYSDARWNYVWRRLQN